jgi:hypothetical protein
MQNGNNQNRLDRLDLFVTNLKIVSAYLCFLLIFGLFTEDAIFLLLKIVTKNG